MGRVGWRFRWRVSEIYISDTMRKEALEYIDERGYSRVRERERERERERKREREEERVHVKSQ